MNGAAAKARSHGRIPPPSVGRSMRSAGATRERLRKIGLRNLTFISQASSNKSQQSSFPSYVDCAFKSPKPQSNPTPLPPPRHRFSRESFMADRASRLPRDIAPLMVAPYFLAAKCCAHSLCLSAILYFSAGHNWNGGGLLCAISRNLAHIPE